MVNTYNLKRLRQLITPPCQIQLYDKVTSTQLLAKEQILNEQTAKLKVLIANEQTSGQGQFARDFYSPAGTGLYFSLLIPAIRVRNRGLFTTGLSVTIASVIEEFYPDKEIKLKWVNDLYFAGKKIGGILVEQVRGMTICGIGINITTDNFPDILNNKATSLDANCSVDIDRNIIIAAIINQIIQDIPHYQEGKHLLSYRQRSILLGTQVTVRIKGNLITGIAEEINDDGALIIRTMDKKITLVSGEVIKVNIVPA